MAWWAAVIDEVPRASVDALSDALWEAGAAGVQEEPATGLAFDLRQPWDDGPAPVDPARARLTAWFEDPVRDAIVGRIHAHLPEARVGWTDDGADVDWSTAWQQGFTAWSVGPVTVAPPWDDDAPPGALRIEPGTGFGTGEHPTTRQALALLITALDGRHDLLVLDVGTGSGVLALAAASLGHRAHGIDIAEPSILEAREQAVRNGLTGRTVFDTTPLDRVAATADVVVANVHAEALVLLADDLIRRAGRTLILAGILADREAAVLGRFTPSLGPPTHREVDGEWIALGWTR